MPYMHYTELHDVTDSIIVSGTTADVIAVLH